MLAAELVTLCRRMGWQIPAGEVLTHPFLRPVRLALAIAWAGGAEAVGRNLKAKIWSGELL